MIHVLEMTSLRKITLSVLLASFNEDFFNSPVFDIEWPFDPLTPCPTHRRFIIPMCKMLKVTTSGKLGNFKAKKYT